MKPHILLAALAVSFVLRPASFAAPPASIIVVLTHDHKVRILEPAALAAIRRANGIAELTPKTNP